MTQSSPAQNGNRIRLGDLLLRDGVIAPEQLQRALDEQRAYGGRLGRHLVDMGFLSEPALLDALSRQLRLPKIDLDAPGALSPEAARYCRADLAEQWGFCPVSFDPQRNVLTIAVSDPDPQLLTDVEGFLALKVEPRIAAADAIERAQHRLYHEPAQAETKRLAGLQVSRSQQARQQSDSPFSESLGSAPQQTPAPSMPPVSPALDPFRAQYSQQLQMQQLHLQQIQMQAQQLQAAQQQQSQAFSPGMGYPASYSTSGAYPSYYPAPSAPPPAAPAPLAAASPPATTTARTNAVTLEQLAEQIARLEKTLGAQARALRSLVEVLVDKGVLSKAEMARKQQQSK